jgi:hypothetical protein
MMVPAWLWMIAHTPMPRAAHSAAIPAAGDDGGGGAGAGDSGGDVPGG